MPFHQTPPMLGNQYEDDRLLRSYLKRTLPPEMLQEIEPSLRELGALAGGELYRMQLADRLNEPVLTQWDAWGNRIDHIELTPLWRRAERIAAEYGLVATAFKRLAERLFGVSRAVAGRGVEAGDALLERAVDGVDGFPVVDPSVAVAAHRPAAESDRREVNAGGAELA